VFDGSANCPLKGKWIVGQPQPNASPAFDFGFQLPQQEARIECRDVNHFQTLPLGPLGPAGTRTIFGVEQDKPARFLKQQGHSGEGGCRNSRLAQQFHHCAGDARQHERQLR
jgi:hypothetical protein